MRPTLAAALLLALALGGCCNCNTSTQSAAPTPAERASHEKLVGSTPNAERLERERGPLYR